MRARIIRIGNSRGVRIPKPLLEEAALGDEIELIVEDGTIVIRPAQSARYGWAAEFTKMRAAEDDLLLDDATPTSFDDDEWKW